jgi:hypothetical protein
MELTLNLAWALLAALMFCLWLRPAERSGAEPRTQSRRVQFVALALVLLILFPVISVTDDLMAVQNPAETDSCQRKDHVCSGAHCISPAVAAPPEPVFAGLSFGFQRLTAPGYLPSRAASRPELEGIQNRPPPAA